MTKNDFGMKTVLNPSISAPVSGKIKMVKLVKSHLVYLIEDLTEMKISSEINPPL